MNLFGYLRIFDCIGYSLIVSIRELLHEIDHIRDISLFCRFSGTGQEVVCYALKGGGDENYLIVAVEMLDQIAYMPQPVSVSNGNTTKLHYQARHRKNLCFAIFAAI